MDFNPNFEEQNKPRLPVNKAEESPSINSKDSLSIMNLVGVASTHIKDMETCRQDLKDQKDILREFLPLMSAKEAIEYYKATVREMEIHAKALRDIYTIAMRTELAKQLLLSGSREERTIKNITPRIRNLVGLLQKTTDRSL